MRNFISIQHGSSIASEGYEPPPVRTGMESVIAHRTGDLFAQTAKQAGKVIGLTDDLLTIEYKDGSQQAIEIGRRYGTGGGMVFPHEIVTDLTMGQSIKPETVLAYNTQYFDRDPLDSSQVLLKNTLQVKTVLWESPDTLEDSSTISQATAERFRSLTTHRRRVVVEFDQLIRQPRKVGSEVDYEDVLCILEDPTTVNEAVMSQDAMDTLKKISSKAPKAKFSGTLERIEVLYNGDTEDMSESLLKLVKASDKRIKTINKAKGRNVTSGRVDNSMSVEGNPLAPDTAVIDFYMTGPEPATGGDRGGVPPQSILFVRAGVILL